VELEDQRAAGGDLHRPLQEGRAVDLHHRLAPSLVQTST
jgi:hypothetical protein